MRVKVAEDTAENSQRELKDYKDKAARILQVSCWMIKKSFRAFHKENI